MRLGAAKLAGLVPLFTDDGFPPSGGSGKGYIPSVDWDASTGPDVGMCEILLSAESSKKSCGLIGLIRILATRTGIAMWPAVSSSRAELLGMRTIHPPGC
jgi:hypothetical protein